MSGPLAHGMPLTLTPTESFRKTFRTRATKGACSGSPVIEEGSIADGRPYLGVTIRRTKFTGRIDPLFPGEAVSKWRCAYIGLYQIFDEFAPDHAPGRLRVECRGFGFQEGGKEGGKSMYRRAGLVPGEPLNELRVPFPMDLRHQRMPCLGGRLRIHPRRLDSA